ncbi:MAG: hypothetical protein EHM59_17815 [Betaproteobacteria bacterium]|nr:MAG: hypothetical protein EHM59_17815 [Betaproteobacteria bacterium]
MLSGLDAAGRQGRALERRGDGAGAIDAVLRGAAPRWLSRLFRDFRGRDDGRQHRARHQLLTLVQMHARERVRGRVIGLYGMSALGLRAFSGVTVGMLGSLIGIHYSLAFSALALLAVTTALLAFTLRPARA